MKILFVSSSCGGGGAERVAVRLSNALSQLGYEVVYVYWKEKKNQEYEFCSKVEVIKIQNFNVLFRILKTREVIDKSKPDIIFSFADMPNIVAYYAGRIAAHKCLVIPNIRINVLEKYRNIKNNVIAKSISKIHGIVCRSAAITIANSLESREAAISHFGINPNRIICIYNPVFDDLCLPCFSKKVYEDKKDKLSAITIGRLCEAKNHFMLLKSMHYAINVLNVDMSLDIYGEGELFDELSSKIKCLGLVDRVFLKGFEKDVEKKISRYDIFLFTSRWEGLPNVLIEALGSGVDIVATDCPSGPKEILKNGKFGKLVEVDDFKGMAKEISDIYYHGKTSSCIKDIESQMSVELKEHLKQFTIPYVAGQYIDVVLREIDQHQSV